MDVVHNALLDQDNAYIVVDLANSVWNVIKTIFAGLVVGLAVAAIVYLTAGVAVPAIVGALGGTVSAVSSGLIATAFIGGAVVGGAVFNSNYLPDDLILPLYSVTPEEIFSGEMAVFDVDFFNPNTEQQEIKIGDTGEGSELSGTWGAWNKESIKNSIKEQYGIDVSDETLNFDSVPQGQRTERFVGTALAKNESGEDVNTDVYIVYLQWTQDMSRGGTREDPKCFIATKANSSTSITRYKSIAYRLRPTIASWYIALRNIAVVGSLSILVYIAIRIIISSSSADKSKYKQRLYDWLVSLLLIFVMHYIMAGSNIFVEKFSSMLNSVQKPAFAPVIQLSKENEDKDKIVKALKENRDTLVAYNIIPEEVDEESVEEQLITQQDGEDIFIWPTNLMGFIRLKAQMMKSENSVSYAGYTLMFAVLVMFTLIFMYTYFKRVLSLAFLTIIAPFVAMTYALDKLKDGSAQGFNNWFKEYMVNLIIQPIHLLLYTVLVSSAIELAEINLIYGLVALGFMIPSEKLVRKFFGVSTTETQGFLAGPAGAALTMAGVNRLLGHRPPPRPTENDTANKKTKINLKDKLDTDEIFGGKSSDNKSNGRVGISPISGATSNKDGGDTSGGADGATALGGTDIPQAKTISDSTGTEGHVDIPDDSSIRMDSSTPDVDVPRLLPSNIGDITNPNSIKGELLRKKLTRENAKRMEDYYRQNHPISSRVRKAGSAAGSYARRTLNAPVMSGLRRGMKYYGRGLGQNIANAINRGDIGRKAIRFAGGMGTATLAGATAFAASIPSGDLKSIVQNTSAATLGGLKLGSSITDYSTGALNVSDATQYFARGYYGDDEYEKRQRDDIVKKMARDRLNDEFIRDFSLKTKMQEKEAKAYLKQDGFLEEGLRYGFSDANEFAAAKIAKDELRDQKQAFNYTKLVKAQGSDINAFEYDQERKISFQKALKEKFSANMISTGNQKKDDEILNNNVNTLYNRLLKISDVYYKE